MQVKPCFSHLRLFRCKGSNKEFLHQMRTLPSRPKLLQKYFSNKNCFGTINIVNIGKQTPYKANSFACSLAKRDKPVTAILHRKCSSRISSVIITKITTKIIVPRNYFVIISARMVRPTLQISLTFACLSLPHQEQGKGP